MQTQDNCDGNAVSVASRFLLGEVAISTSHNFEFRAFLSPRLRDLPRLKNPVCPTIYLLLKAEEEESCLY